MRTLTNTSLYIIVLDYLMPLLGTFNSHTETMNGTVHRTVYFQNIFSREIGHSGSQVVRSMKREEKMAALCGDVFISKQTFFCCIPVFQSFLSLTLHIPLLVKGTPLTYTLDKFRARKCIFWTVFLCQICMGLHEIYSYALLTKREVKMAGYWPGSFVAFLWSETNKPGQERRYIPRSISVFISCFVFISSPRREGRRWMDK